MGFIVFGTFFVVAGVAAFILARREGRQRAMRCVECDHSMFHHGSDGGLCLFIDMHGHDCMCEGGHAFVHRSVPRSKP